MIRETSSNFSSPTIFWRPSLIFCLFVVAALWGASAAHAVPISYSATGTATLSITSISPTILPDNVFIINSPLPSHSPPLEEITGNATVATGGSAHGIGDPSALRVGDGYVHETSASGTADAPAPSRSFAFSLASGQVLVDNESSDVTVTVDFLLSYRLEASALIDEPAFEDAFAFADVQLNWEPISDTHDFFVDTAASDDRFGDPTLVDTSFAFSLVVLPGNVGNASLQTASSGNADVSPIPEPGTPWLLGLSVLGLGLARNKRRMVAELIRHQRSPSGRES